MTDQFTLDIQAINERARQNIGQGAVTGAQREDVSRLLDVLNQVVATEVVCYLRYTQNAVVADGIDSTQVAAVLRDHAAEELEHFQRISDRISQLGGDPDMNPATLMVRSHTSYFAPAAGSDLQAMLRENLVGERIVIETYAEIARWIGDNDITTRRLIEQILQEEEDHADELNDLYQPDA